MSKGAAFLKGGGGCLALFFAAGLVALLFGGSFYFDLGGLLCLFVFGGLLGLGVYGIYHKGAREARKQDQPSSEDWPRRKDLL